MTLSRKIRRQYGAHCSIFPPLRQPIVAALCCTSHDIPAHGKLRALHKLAGTLDSTDCTWWDTATQQQHTHHKTRVTPRFQRSASHLQNYTCRLGSQQEAGTTSHLAVLIVRDGPHRLLRQTGLVAVRRWHPQLPARGRGMCVSGNDCDYLSCLCRQSLHVTPLLHL